MPNEQPKTCAYCVNAIGFLDYVCTVHLEKVVGSTPACSYFTNVIQFTYGNKKAA